MFYDRRLELRLASKPHRIGPWLTTFRINTCKSVSKQSTLTAFRINTCEKPRGGGGAYRSIPKGGKSGSGAGNQDFLALISSRIIAATTGFRISRVTACSISGLILASTFATSASMSGGAEETSLAELPASTFALCTTLSTA